MIGAELFAHENGLPVLLLPPVLWGLSWALDRRRRRRLLEYTRGRTAALAADLDLGQRWRRRAVAAVALFFGLLAALRPEWGEEQRTVEQRGVDVVLCLDVSRSMLARDLKPSRLAAAKQELRRASEHLRTDRLALVLFAGEARLAVPLTQDRASFLELAELADPLSVRLGGTNLGAALECALEALAGRSGDHETIVLLTDGEDLDGRGLEVAERCRQRNITVHCLGLGSALGSKIPVDDGRGESYLRDRDGQEVVSALDPRSLQRVARATGGEFLSATGRPEALSSLFEKNVFPMAQRTYESERRPEPVNRFQWPLFVAFVLWLYELASTDRRRSAKRPRAA